MRYRILRKQGWLTWRVQRRGWLFWRWLKQYHFHLGGYSSEIRDFKASCDAICAAEEDANERKYAKAKWTVVDEVEL